jgi:hypothetical protein
MFIMLEAFRLVVWYPRPRSLMIGTGSNRPHNLVRTHMYLVAVERAMEWVGGDGCAMWLA